MQIENAVTHFQPDIFGEIPFRIHQRVVDGEVFLKRDLALHGGSPVVATSCNVAAY